MSPVRDLDDRWLPRAARALRSVVHRPRGRATAAGSAVRAAVGQEPALVAAILTVLVGGVLLGVFGTDQLPDTSPSAPTPAATPSVASVGAPPGTDVASYLRDATYRLRHFTDFAGDRSTFALVDLRHYEQAGAAAHVLHGTTPAAVFLRSPSRLPTPYCRVAVRSPSGIAHALQVAAGVVSTNAENARKRARLADRKPSADNGGLAVADLRGIATALGVESTRFSDPACRCVFALLVNGDANELTMLASLRAVRAVDPAPVGVGVDRLQQFPLLPDEHGTVEMQPPGCG